jgi:hypothetical protein
LEIPNTFLRHREEDKNSAVLPEGETRLLFLGGGKCPWEEEQEQVRLQGGASWRRKKTSR